MTFYNTTINATMYVVNQGTGGMVAMTPRPSDVLVVSKLCGSFGWYVVFQMTFVLTLLFLKAWMQRLKNKPNAPEGVGRLYQSVDNIIDGVLTIFCVVQLGLAIMSLIG